ncbi:DedA family protein [Ureibacillus endophyticus]|uniref:DedA family protein n=1 Tax=Ureibacillus endophyticus TaxID=1978490 RepID=A0A494YT13_9BACL|nr:DedA family protein [Lysinibacillus endophyticus]RKQ13271.1 DedA family protein [Lysinibacillus endophyticus]
MDYITWLFDFIMHIDVHLRDIVAQYHEWVYAIVFLIVFVETGLVIMPFLPGDSLLFASGALAAMGGLNLWLCLIIFFVAAVVGDTVNYHIGYKIGKSIPENSFLGKMINKDRMQKAQEFFDRHGGKTIIFARFMPFIRTFIPFIAGASKMRYAQFLTYNIVGGLLWVLIGVFCGYFFGNIPFISEHFSTVILAIIVLSLIPAVIGLVKSRVKAA